MSLWNSIRVIGRSAEQRGVGITRSLVATAGAAASTTVPASHGYLQPQQQRYFSSSLLRPPSLGQPEPRTMKLRKHAVPLNTADYGDPRGQFDQLETEHDAMDDGEDMQLAQEALRFQKELDAKKKRWLENAKAPVRVPIIDERGRAYGRGGRKAAAARVWIQPGFGVVTINRQDVVDYFNRDSDREHLLEPLAATRTCGKFDVTAHVHGGGLRGKAGAIRHGLARALNAYNPDAYRPALKRLGYLTRDPRKVERKKIGHVKARKKPQWVKR